MPFLIYLVLLSAVYAYSCGPTNIETMIGGYPFAHDIITFTFDVDPINGDMVVAGQMSKNDLSTYLFVYFIDNKLCKVRWMIED